MSDPGAAAEGLAALPRDLAALRRISSGLVFRYRGGGDFEANGIAPERICEIDTRYADAMFARLAELGGPLTAERTRAQRLLGCCRDFTLLFGGAAWQQARAGQQDAARFAVSSSMDLPMLRGWQYLRHNLVLDLAGLSKCEVVLWDAWGVIEPLDDPSEPEAHAGRARCRGPQPDPDLTTLRDWAARDDLAIAAAVISYSPAHAGERMRLQLR